MALVGYRAKRDEIAQKMAEIERELGARHKSEPTSGTPTMASPARKPKRTMSAAGKKAIRAALKKRWAAYHAQAGAVTPAKKSANKPKRSLSPAAKAKLAANLAKARAAKAKKHRKAYAARRTREPPGP